MPYKRIDIYLCTIILIIFSFVLGYAVGEHKQIRECKKVQIK
jgi:hypothetical protein